MWEIREASHPTQKNLLCSWRNKRFTLRVNKEAPLAKGAGLPLRDGHCRGLAPAQQKRPLLADKLRSSNGRHGNGGIYTSTIDWSLRLALWCSFHRNARTLDNDERGCVHILPAFIGHCTADTGMEAFTLTSRQTNCRGFSLTTDWHLRLDSIGCPDSYLENLCCLILTNGFHLSNSWNVGRLNRLEIAL